MAISKILRKLDYLFDLWGPITYEYTINLLVNEKISGHLTYSLSNDTCHIHEFFILEEYRDQGHGTFFLKEFIQETKVNKFILEPDPINPNNILLQEKWKKDYKRLIKFYERIGFKMEESHDLTTYMIYMKKDQ